MSRFTAPLIVTPTEDYSQWRVIATTCQDQFHDPKPDTATFGYDIGEEHSGVSVEVPHGFETDLASIPWYARWGMKTWGRHTNAAVIHDYLYRGGKIRTGPDNVYPKSVHRTVNTLDIPLPTRKQADQIMLEAMLVMEVPAWKAKTIYRALRTGGWVAWRRNRS